MDGGNNWKTVAKDIPTTNGWNSYTWIPGDGGMRARVKVEGLTASNVLIAADGSYKNFNVKPQISKGSWKKIFGPTGLVVAGYDKSKGVRKIYATDFDTGDIYMFGGKPGGIINWFKIGGPGKMFVLDNLGRLYGLSPDGSGVYQYTGTGDKWIQIGGPAKEIYGDVDGVLATNPQTGDLYRYLGSPNFWRKVGGPGLTFACDAKGYLFGLSPDGSGVWRYDGLFGPPVPWIPIGGPASNLYARGFGVYATNPQTGDIHIFQGLPFIWTNVGGPKIVGQEKAFSVDVEGRLYCISSFDIESGGDIWRYDGSFDTPNRWTKIGGAAAYICAGWREILAIHHKTKELWINRS